MKLLVASLKSKKNQSTLPVFLFHSDPCTGKALQSVSEDKGEYAFEFKEKHL